MTADHMEHCTVPVPVELTEDAPDTFRAAVDLLIVKRSEAITLDCTRVDHLTSSHVKLLWSARIRCAEEGVALRLKSSSEYVWKVLKILDLDEFFIRDEDVDADPKGVVPAELIGALDGYEDTFEAEAESIGTAVEGFLNYLKSISVPIGTQYVLRTLFYEVATNIRLHGATKPAEQIKFSAMLDSSGIVLTFVDNGPHFDPTQFDISDFSYQEGSDGRRSFGITILQKLADRLDYERLDDSKNVLILERKWRLSQWTKQSSHSAL